MKSVQHIMGHDDSGPDSCLRIYAGKAMKENVYLWYEHYNQAIFIFIFILGSVSLRSGSTAA
jgi:hypothetical protein